MEHLKFEELLKQKMGLDPASVGADTVERALILRMQSCGLSRKEDYWDRIQLSQDELQQLIEAVVVPETCFFRDQEAFEVLGRLIAEEWIPNHPADTLHLLSAPCSTGEEPYSMVMALLDSGFSRDRLRADAVDISVRALAFAQRGIYGSNSFRGQSLTYRDRYFEKASGGYALSATVREKVIFHQMNLLSPAFHLGSRLYDVIFCRNMLIYFDRPTQERVLGSLGQLLAPDGFLFVGPAEAFLATCSGFKSVNRALAFAFHKRVNAPQEKQMIRPTRLKKSVKPPARAVSSSPEQTKATTVPPAAPVVHPEGDLAAARRLADAGNLREATAACEAHLRQHGSSSEGYYLLGLIHDAKGDASHAEECYRRVLYVEPGHSEALMHLALLLEKRNDMQGAQRVRARARRAE
jgi:chemotaxis protein methyltransferase WspC